MFAQIIDTPKILKIRLQWANLHGHLTTVTTCTGKRVIWGEQLIQILINTARFVRITTVLSLHEHKTLISMTMSLFSLLNSCAHMFVLPSRKTKALMISTYFLNVGFWVSLMRYFCTLSHLLSGFDNKNMHIEWSVITLTKVFTCKVEMIGKNLL